MSGGVIHFNLHAAVKWCKATSTLKFNLQPRHSNLNYLPRPKPPNVVLADCRRFARRGAAVKTLNLGHDELSLDRLGVSDVNGIALIKLN